MEQNDLAGFNAALHETHANKQKKPYNSLVFNYKPSQTKNMHILRHSHTVLTCLFITFSLTGAIASQPAQLPCSALQQNNNQPVCMRSHNLSMQNTTTQPTVAATTSNLAVDQALVALTDDVTIVPKSVAADVAMKVDLRHNEPVAVKTKVKNQAAKATKVAYRAAPVKAVAVKPQLTRSQIVRNELNREKAALRAAEGNLASARKTGKNASVLERQVADRRASISAMQAELARL